MNIKENNLSKVFSNIFMYQDNSHQYNFILPETQEEQSKANNAFIEDLDEQDNNVNIDNININSDFKKNLEFLEVKYNTLINSDIIIKNFDLVAFDQKFSAFIIYIDGMVNADTINSNILEPLMIRNLSNIKKDNTPIVFEDKAKKFKIKKKSNENLLDLINLTLLTQNSVQIENSFSNIISGINSGNCALFVNTIDKAFNIDVKGFKQRSIDSPQNELVIRGAQEAFTEVIRTNTSLIRRLVNNENLVIESIKVGKLSQTSCAVCYMKNIASNDLVAEVKYRLNNLDIDYLISSGQLEQLIDDNSNSTFPQMIATERPDKTTNYILDGRVAVIVNGSPYVLVMPGVFLDFLASPEDTNLKYQFSNFLKFLRILSYIITLLLPGLYLAITTFHIDTLPAELLFSIVSARNEIPFPTLLEVLVMSLSFELIREAGLRVPSAIGSTIGIVGALLIGQSAVEAKIVSPILIIIIAVTGIASFTIPDFSLSFHCRIVQFLFTILGALLGFLGIGIGLFYYLLSITSLYSFGVPYFVPFSPVTNMKGNKIFLEAPWKREFRKDFLNVKREKKQKHISMAWKYKK